MKNSSPVKLVFIIFFLSILITGYSQNKSSVSKLNNIKKYNPEKPWFIRSYSGISLNTPEELELQHNSLPEEYKTLVYDVKMYTHFSDKVDLVVIYYFFKSNQYNVLNGLKYSMNNAVNKLNGENLEIETEYLGNQNNEIVGTGTFTVNNIEYIVKAYCYHNGKGEVVLIGCSGEKYGDAEYIRNRIFESINVRF